MWGICLDSSACQNGLFQGVIQYEISSNNEVRIISPRTSCRVDFKKIRELPIPPKYVYGQRVIPRNHPDIIGVIMEIRWHFKRECCFYIIQVGKRIKSKRYFDDDLIPA